jgi:hypothetical protein
VSVHPFSISRASRVKGRVRALHGPRLGSYAATTGVQKLRGKAEVTRSSGSTTVKKSHRQHMKAGDDKSHRTRVTPLWPLCPERIHLLIKLESRLCIENESLFQQLQRNTPYASSNLIVHSHLQYEKQTIPRNRIK